MAAIKARKISLILWPKYVMLMTFLLFTGVISLSSSLADGGGALKTEGRCIESERRALLAIAADMYDPFDDWLSSWTAADCCTWRGVACDAATGHVTKLDLRFPYPDDVGNIDASTVNPSLRELQHLKYLDLSLNNFSFAGVPEAVVSLPQLQYLNLSSAMFAGAVPPRFGNLSGLRYLDLNGCFGDLHADDLTWLSRLPSLRYLDMSCINISKAANWLESINSIPSLEVLHLQWADPPFLPPALPPFNLSSITVFDVSGSLNINTSVLGWLSNATGLEYLELSSCGGFDIGPLQSALGALVNLQELDLSANDIGGEISAIVGNVSRRLRMLDLRWNKLTGNIARTLGSLKHLEFITLDNNQLTGQIPEMLGDFTSLRFLTFSSNQISGRIPQSVGKLRRLEYIYLSGNNITGEIPASIGNLTNLIHLFIGRNAITGPIPVTVGNLLNLQQLYLSDNNITGQLPESIGELKNLQALYLQNNFITGPIPSAVGGLQSLLRLHISSNRLSGHIPRGMGTLCNLEYLDLSDNKIAGEITDLIDGLSQCPQPLRLFSLHLSDNNLNGGVPPSLGQLKELSEVYLSSNSLVGNVTEAHFTELAILKFLDISQNNLRVVLPDDWVPPFDAFTIGMSYCHIGTLIPSWIQTQTLLQNLYLSGTGLEGRIPAWFSHFNPQGWHYLDLSSNSLSGPLPVVSSVNQSIINLSNNSFSGPILPSFAASLNASILTLSDNLISGKFPPFFCNMNFLEVLDLSNNRLSGEFPDCLRSYPTSLQSLHLNNNSLSGRLPSFLKHCKQLITLDLGENKLIGELPQWIGRSLSSLKVLRLRSNLFHGAISPQIANLSSLHVLDLANNNLHGAIPSSIGSLNAMVTVQNVMEPLIDSNAKYYSEHVLITTKGSTIEYSTVLSLVTSIDLSDNNLNGAIPQELTKLHGLHFLNLSENHLMAKIPSEIGDMSQLESLDLSMNNLTGEIPAKLATLNFLSHLNLSYNNLSGRIPTSNQLQTLNDPSIYIGNKDLCGMPLAECPREEGPARGGTQEGKNESDKLETILNITSLIIGFVVGFWGFVGTLIMKERIRIAVFQFIDRMCYRLALKFAHLKCK
ncbi:LRR receptor-like serine/threonine-protein kinase FLS2 [Canna indica]|uniref:LRR receptor-like serine/threonine-protein kinase FLS2 n=1 Tax=Canna indica TaxID=4628 RepID=A0AAQ3KYS4_9LILI|nr:LRR receptor-like serine/threonine-protein kinase FLS2 [Canna indica]